MATKKTAEMITVACKLPQGLVIPLDQAPDLVLHGPNSPFALAGFGMTDVKSATWAAVEKKYADAAWLNNEVVFAMGDRESAVDKAEELKGEKAGFEPVDPLKPGVVTPAN